MILGSLVAHFWLHLGAPGAVLGPVWSKMVALVHIFPSLVPPFAPNDSPRLSKVQFWTIFGYFWPIFAQYFVIFDIFWFTFLLLWQLVDAFETCLGLFLFIVFELSFATPSRGGLTPGL